MQAKAEGVQESFKMGYLEILMVVRKGLKHLEELNRRDYPEGSSEERLAGLEATCRKAAEG